MKSNTRTTISDCRASGSLAVFRNQFHQRQPGRLAYSPAIVAALFMRVGCVTGFAQGSLTPPPGVPSPNMKTLDQVEPRTPISALPYTISQPGSYYVTTNLTGVAGANGITINASHVTLDLGGFVLTGVPGSLDGVSVRQFDGENGPETNVCVRNGTVNSWGGSGVRAYTTSVGIIENLRALGNGGSGLAGGLQSIIRGCLAKDNNAYGTEASGGSVVTECVASVPSP